MKRTWKRFYEWSHTDLGDSIVCGVGMLMAMMSARALMWLVIGMGN